MSKLSGKNIYNNVVFKNIVPFIDRKKLIVIVIRDNQKKIFNLNSEFIGKEDLRSMFFNNINLDKLLAMLKNKFKYKELCYSDKFLKYFLKVNNFSTTDDTTRYILKTDTRENNEQNYNLHRSIVRVDNFNQVLSHSRNNQNLTLDMLNSNNTSEKILCMGHKDFIELLLSKYMHNIFNVYTITLNVLFSQVDRSTSCLSITSQELIENYSCKMDISTESTIIVCLENRFINHTDYIFFDIYKKLRDYKENNEYSLFRSGDILKVFDNIFSKEIHFYVEKDIRIFPCVTYNFLNKKSLFFEWYYQSLNLYELIHKNMITFENNISSDDSNYTVLKAYMGSRNIELNSENFSSILKNDSKIIIDTTISIINYMQVGDVVVKLDVICDNINLITDLENIHFLIVSVCYHIYDFELEYESKRILFKINYIIKNGFVKNKEEEDYYNNIILKFNERPYYRIAEPKNFLNSINSKLEDYEKSFNVYKNMLENEKDNYIQKKQTSYYIDKLIY